MIEKICTRTGKYCEYCSEGECVVWKYGYKCYSMKGENPTDRHLKNKQKQDITQVECKICGLPTVNIFTRLHHRCKLKRDISYGDLFRARIAKKQPNIGEICRTLKDYSGEEEFIIL